MESSRAAHSLNPPFYTTRSNLEQVKPYFTNMAEPLWSTPFGKGPSCLIWWERDSHVDTWVGGKDTRVCRPHVPTNEPPPLSFLTLQPSQRLLGKSASLLLESPPLESQLEGFCSAKWVTPGSSVSCFPGNVCFSPLLLANLPSFIIMNLYMSITE